MCLREKAAIVSGESEERPGDYRLQHKRKAWPLPAQSSHGSETVAYIVSEKGIECDIWHKTIQPPAYMDSGAKLMHFNSALAGVKGDSFCSAEATKLSHGAL